MADAHPRAGRRASGRRAHAGVGDRAAVRAVAAALVPPGDAACRLLDRARRSAGPAGAGHRRRRCEHAAVLDASLGDRYVSEFYGLRPEVLLALYVERGLWERFLARAAPARAAARVRRRGTRQLPSVAGRRPLWHCGGRRAHRDASGSGPGRPLPQRGGPPRPRGVPAVRQRRTRACSSCWSTMGAWTARGRSSSACARRHRRR